MKQEFAPLPAPQLAEVPFFEGKTIKELDEKETRAIDLLTDNGLMEACGLRIAFTGRRGGVSAEPYQELNLGLHVGDDARSVDANRIALMEALGVASEDRRNCVHPVQVHGNDVLSVGKDIEAGAFWCFDADGIVCAKEGVPVLLCFADCVSVILAAPNGAFAVLHAGWRGALASIPGKGLKQLAEETGCDPADCNAYIGPHIGACCYETSADILRQFVDRYGQQCDAGDRHLDLTAAVSASLLEAGADSDRICDAGVCTSCRNDVYFSYRADGGTTGRHGAFAYRRI